VLALTHEPEVTDTSYESRQRQLRVLALTHPPD
jgi:hypothetical protein